MTEKRFTKQESTIEKYMLYDNNKENAYFITCDEGTINAIVDLLNEQQSTITKLEQICEKKMQEIENIKYSLKEIAYKYQKEVQFKADTDPNQAVKEVLCEQQATIERLERKLELKTEEVEYLKRMMVKWGMVKDE